MKFEITFPAGWATHNGSQSVQAGAPNQDAAMQLSFADATSAADAATKLTSVQGLTVVRSSAQTVNGLPARLVEFDLASQNGTIHGLIEYVEYGGAVYEIAGYATSAAWAGYTSVVQQSLGSIRTLTDSRYLNVAPNRINIVRLPGA